jgi:hypothetical protein
MCNHVEPHQTMYTLLAHKTGRSRIRQLHLMFFFFFVPFKEQSYLVHANPDPLSQLHMLNIKVILNCESWQDLVKVQLLGGL